MGLRHDARAMESTTCLQRQLAFIASALLALATTSSAVADTREAEAEASAERWLPGFAVTSTGFFQERSGSVTSGERGTTLGDSNAAFWSMGLDAELMTPAVRTLPGIPRVFAHAGALLSFDKEDPVANEDDPGRPQVKTLQPSGFRPFSGVTGTGSATRIETRPLIWSAGLGVAFQTQLGGLVLRIKPSIEWQFQRDRIRAALGHAEVEGPTPDMCTPCRLLFIDATTSQAYHSIGPGLELEVDAARLGEAFVLTVFTSTHALAIIGSRETDFGKTQAWTTNGMPSVGRAPSTVVSTYRRDRWQFRAGVGLRVRWFPEPLR